MKKHNWSGIWQARHWIGLVDEGDVPEPPTPPVPPIPPHPGELTARDVISRARSLSGYKYWFGGAGQIATVELANILQAQNPGVWTNSYYNKAMKDLGQRVADCSYLVNFAYTRASPGNHGASTSQYESIYSRWSGSPRNGMILWRKGHTAIYNRGHTMEMVGIDYDYMERPYNPDKWQRIYYDPRVDYSVD